MAYWRQFLLAKPLPNGTYQIKAEKDGYQFVDFGGKGGCYPNITWQLRKVYILEGDPIDENHPISKRVHYVDAQTFTLPRTLIYDRKGDLWKSWIIGQVTGVDGGLTDLKVG